MKTMWFTFFYAFSLPFGIILSLVSLAIYYYVDKYNLLRRRTVKCRIGRKISVEMIELLEITIIIFALGQFVF